GAAGDADAGDAARGRRGGGAAERGAGRRPGGGRAGVPRAEPAVRAPSFGPTDRPWERLAGALAPEVLRAPRTAGDPASTGQWPAVHARAAGYLARNARAAPWVNQLALAAAVLSARRLDVHTVTQRLMVLHHGFGALLPALGLTTMDGWDADAHLPAYLRGDVLPAHRQR